MIAAAERRGHVGPDQRHLVEATAGCTGLGLALVAAQRGYRLTLVIADKMSQEKVQHLRALGAQVVLTRSDVEKGHADYYQDLAQRIVVEERAFYVNQFGNPANPLAHETTTGPEIVEQLDGRLHAMVCGVGSGEHHHRPVSPLRPDDSVLRDGARRPGGLRSPSLATTADVNIPPSSGPRQSHFMQSILMVMLMLSDARFPPASKAVATTAKL